MNEMAMKLVKEAMLRVLAKNPGDAEFFREKINDPSYTPEYRQVLQDALEEWRHRSRDPRD